MLLYQKENRIKNINGDVPQSTILFILEIGYLYQYFF
jgi:hypothetical protein